MSEQDEVLNLSPERLDALGLTTLDVVQMIEKLARGRAAGTVWSAPKGVITPPDGRYMMSTMAACDEPSFLSVKALVLNPRNSEHGLPQINSLVTLLHGETGLPAAVIDGNWITAVRTAGLSAVAARKLANPDAAVIAFVGCGVQARSHLDVFADLFPLTAIRAFGKGARNRDALCEKARGMGLEATAPSDPREALADADLVITSVPLNAPIEPFLDAGWLKPGAFASITDASVPWHRESYTAFDRVFIDDIEQESHMPNPMIATGQVTGDFTGLVNGDPPGRTDPAQRTAFLFRGLALGDLALAVLAYQRASGS